MYLRVPSSVCCLIGQPHSGNVIFFVYIYFVKLSSKACSDAQLFYITIEPKKFTTVHCKDSIAVEVGMERYGWPINWIDKKVF